MNQPKRPHIMILAGEYSGILYGSYVARKILEIRPDARLTGVGGPIMAEAGVDILFDSSNWGGIGLVEALKRSHLYFVYVKLKRIIRAERPDVIILIDYPGFNMQVARFAKSIGIPTVYHLPPGKYPGRPEAVQGVANTLTKVAAPLGVTYEKYTFLRANVEFVGHPLLDVMPERIDPREARRSLGVPPEKRVVGLLPGSRLAEIEYHTPVLCRAASRLAERHPDLQFVIPLVNYRTKSALRRAVGKLDLEIRRSGAPIHMVMEQAYEVMAASEVLIAASGTATLEAAYFGTPMVIVYRTSKLTEWLALWMYRKTPIQFVGLPNILAGRQIVTELLQGRFTEENVVNETEALLQHRDRLAAMRADLRALLPLLGSKGASERVARMALSLAPPDRVTPAPVTVSVGA